MSRLTSWIRDYFGFSRVETNAFLILLPLMFIILFIEPAYQYWFTHQKQNFTNEEKKLDSLLAIMKWKTKDSPSAISKTYAMFAFDPNQVSTDSLQMLGLRSSIAKRINNYRIKGGKFFSINDLKKIYGMDSAWVKKAERYLIIPPKREGKKFEPSEPRPVKVAARTDINMADTTQLKAIYGIGSKLATRVIAYREKLGGFISMSQLKEVYGLDSMVIQEVNKKFIVAENSQPMRLNINTADEKKLAAHPYIKWKLARVIVAYRHQHGDFQQVEELKGISIINDETFQKIKPYLSANP